MNKKIILILIVFFTTGILYAEKKYKYGGTASVKVKKTNGEREVIYKTVSCVYDTKAEAKQKLIRKLESSYYKFISHIYYDIDRCKKPSYNQSYQYNPNYKRVTPGGGPLKGVK